MPTTARATRSGYLRGRGRRPGGWACRTLPAAAPPPFLPFAFADGEEELATVLRLGLGEAPPPARELRQDFAALGAQHQEVIAGAKARMREEAERPLARALVEPRLDRPDLLHRRGQPPRDVELDGLELDHVVHRRVERRHRALALRLARAPRGEHLVPQQRREQER